MRKLAARIVKTISSAKSLSYCEATLARILAMASDVDKQAGTSHGSESVACSEVVLVSQRIV